VLDVAIRVNDMRNRVALYAIAGQVRLDDIVPEVTIVREPPARGLLSVPSPFVAPSRDDRR